jgi:hypothetical protein
LTKLTIESPFSARFMAWVHERFPLPHAVLFFVLYGTAAVVGRALTGTGVVSLGLPDLAGFFAAWSFFLMLRVFDEHKDFELDLSNHPERVLQRGLITRKHLKVAASLAIIIQLGASLSFDGGTGPVTCWWLLVIGWSGLMAKEFFCGAWLERRLLLYAVSHMVVMPMALLWMAQIGAGSAALPPAIGLLAAMSFCSGAAFEVTRKCRGPEEERPTVDSYSKVLGRRGAVATIVVLLGLGAGLEWLLLTVLIGTPTAVWGAAVIGSLIPALISLARFSSAPSLQGRERNEGAVSLAMLAGYVVVLVAVAVTRGLAWV